MRGDSPRPLRILVFSSGNPAATFLAMGLLHGRPESLGTVLVQGVGDETPTWEVERVLAEVGRDVRSWVSQIMGAPLGEAVDVGITICVPT